MHIALPANDSALTQFNAVQRDTLACIAGIAQLVERQLPKLNVEGSSPFARFLASLEAVNPALRAGVTSLRCVTGTAGAPLAGRCESLCPL